MKGLRLSLGVVVLVALFLLASRMDRLPGAAGTAIQRNAAHDRGAGIFYTDVEDWLALLRRMKARLRARGAGALAPSPSPPGPTPSPELVPALSHASL